MRFLLTNSIDLSVIVMFAPRKRSRRSQERWHLTSERLGQAQRLNSFKTSWSLVALGLTCICWISEAKSNICRWISFAEMFVPRMVMVLFQLLVQKLLANDGHSNTLTTHLSSLSAREKGPKGILHPAHDLSKALDTNFMRRIHKVLGGILFCDL